MSTNALGETVRYSYDDKARQTTVITDEGVVTKTIRNEQGETFQVWLKDQKQSEIRYDKAGNPVDVRNGVGEQTTHSYDNLNRRTLSTDAQGVKTTFSYDADSRQLSQTIDPAGLNLRSHVNYGHRFEERTDARGTVTRTEFDGNGRPLRIITDPAGLALLTEITYDGLGRAVETRRGTLVNGQPEITYTEQSQYDELGRMTAKIVDPDGLKLTTRYGYDNNGNRIQVTEPDGREKLFIFDQANRLRYSLLPDREVTGRLLYRVTERQYDKVGRQTALVQHGELIERPARSISAVKAALSNSAVDRISTTVFDDDGRISHEVDAKGQVTAYRYDSYGRRVATVVYSNPINGIQQAADAIVDPSKDRETRLIYDTAGRVTHTLQVYKEGNASRALVTETIYTKRGEVRGTIAYAQSLNLVNQTVSDLNPHATENRTALYLYDASGRRTHTVDREGHVTETRYNDADRTELLVRYQHKVTVPSVTNWTTATPASLSLQGSADGDRHTVTTFDKAGRKASTAEKQLINGGTRTFTEFYQYDALNRRTSLTDARGFKRHFSYDSAGRMTHSLKAFTNTKGYLTTYRYDNSGRLTEEVRYSQAVNLTANPASIDLTALQENDDRRVTTTYAQSGQVKTRAVYTETGQPVITETRYNSFGEVATTIEALGLPEQRVTHRDYDALGRMTRETKGLADAAPATLTKTTGEGIATTRYSYSRFGEKASIQDANNGISRQHFDQLGRKTGQTDALNGETRSVLDAFGNIVRTTDPNGNTGYFFYDRSNRLRLKISPDGGATQYTYNSFGEVSAERQYSKRINTSALAGLTLAQAQTRLTEDARSDQRQEMTFDQRGNLVRRVTHGFDAVNNRTQTFTETFGYDTANNRTHHVNRDGARTDYAYDGQGRQIKETGPEVARKLTTNSLIHLRAITHYEYNAFGHRTAMVTGQYQQDGATKTDHHLRRTEYGYDYAGRKVLEQSPEYQAVGNPEHRDLNDDRISTVTLRQTQRSTYDALGRMTQTVKAGEDTSGVVQGQRQVTRNAYDRLDRVTYMLDADGGLTTYRYDAVGNKTLEKRYDQRLSTEQTIKVRLSGDSYQGNPHYKIYADGRVIGEGDITWATPKDQSKVWKELSFKHTGSQPQSVWVEFTNNHSNKENLAKEDRNLRVAWIEVEGKQYSASKGYRHFNHTIPESGHSDVHSTGFLKFTIEQDVHKDRDPSELEITPIGEDFQVHTTTEGNQYHPNITALKDGGYVVVWHSETPGDGASRRVYGQKFDASGNKVGAEFTLNGSSRTQYGQAITATDDGGFIVTWHQYGADGSSWAVLGQRFSATSEPKGSATVLSNTTLDNQSYPEVTEISGGRYLLTWRSHGQDGSGFAVYGRLFDGNLKPLGSEFQVSTTTALHQLNPHAASLADGGFVVTWWSEHTEGEGKKYDIYTQRYDARGNKVGGEQRVNTHTQRHQTEPRVQGLSNGGYVITWQSELQDGSHYGTYAQFYSAGGQRVGAELRVNNYTNSNQYHPRVKELNDGSVLFVWRSYGQDGSAGGVFSRRFSQTGQALTGEVQINKTTSGHQNNPDVAILNDGRAVVVWHSEGQDSGEGAGKYGIYGRFVSFEPVEPQWLRQAQALENNAVAKHRETHFTYDANNRLTSSHNGEGLFFDLSHHAKADNTVRLRLSGDSYEGNPHFKVYADGRVIGEGDVTWATPQGQPKTWKDVSFDFGGQKPKSVWVEFTNDHGKAGVGDRNLIVDWLQLNGTTYQTEQSRYARNFHGAVTGRDGMAWTGRLEFTIEQDAYKDRAPSELTITPTGEDIRVHTTTQGNQLYPETTALSDGGYVVVWRSETAGDTSSRRAYGQKFDAAGNKVGAEFTVNGSSRQQYGHAVTATDDGGFIATWHETGVDGSGWAVLGQIFNADAEPQGEAAVLNGTTSGSQAYPAITPLSGNRYLVLWHSGDGSGSGVNARLFDSTLKPLDGDFRVNTTTALHQYHPRAAALADGGFVVTWWSEHKEGTDSRYDVHSQRYDATGNKVGSEQRVNAHTAHNQRNAQVLGLSNGGYVITWDSYNQDGSHAGVYAQFYSANGQRIAGEKRINSHTNANQEQPRVKELQDGSLLFVWRSYGQDGSSGGVFARRFTQTGQALTGETQINKTTDGHQNSPDVTILADGRAFIVWQSEKQDPGEGTGQYGIYGRFVEFEAPKASADTKLGFEEGVTARSRFVYDANGQLEIEYDPKGQPLYNLYDNAGNRTVQVDREGYVTVSRFSGTGKILTETRYSQALSWPDDKTTPENRLAWLKAEHRAGRELTVVNPAQDRSRTMVWDGRGLLLEERIEDLQRTALNGQLQASDVTSDLVTRYRYDGEQRLLQKQQLNGDKAEGARSTEIVYDKAGEVLAQKLPGFNDYKNRAVRETITFDYDLYGNQVLERRLGFGEADQVTEHRFNDVGLRTEIKDARESRNDDNYDGRTHLYYDGLGNTIYQVRRQTDISKNKATIVDWYQYDAKNRQTARVNNTEANVVHQTAYNTHDQIIGKGINTDQRRNTIGASVDKQYQEYYVYDNLGRLFKTNNKNGTPRLYLYDKNGNATLEVSAKDKDVLSVIDNPRHALNQLKQSEAQWKYSLFDANNRRTTVIDPPISWSDAELQHAVEWEIENAKNNQVNNQKEASDSSANELTLGGRETTVISSQVTEDWRNLLNPNVKRIALSTTNTPVGGNDPVFPAEGVRAPQLIAISYVGENGEGHKTSGSDRKSVDTGEQNIITSIKHLTASDSRLKLENLEITDDQKNQLKKWILSTETELDGSSQGARTGYVETQRIHTQSSRMETLANGQEVTLQTDRVTVTETIRIFAPMTKDGVRYAWREVKLVTTTGNYDVTTQFPDADSEQASDALTSGKLTQLPKLDWKLYGKNLTLGGDDLTKLLGEGLKVRLHQIDESGQTLLAEASDYVHEKEFKLEENARRVGLTFIDRSGITLYTTDLFQRADESSIQSGRLSIPLGGVGQDGETARVIAQSGVSVSRTGNERTTDLTYQEVNRTREVKYSPVGGAAAINPPSVTNTNSEVKFETLGFYGATEGYFHSKGGHGHYSAYAGGRIRLNLRNFEFNEPVVIEAIVNGHKYTKVITQNGSAYFETGSFLTHASWKVKHGTRFPLSLNMQVKLIKGGRVVHAISVPTTSFALGRNDNIAVRTPIDAKAVPNDIYIENRFATITGIPTNAKALLFQAGGKDIAVPVNNGKARVDTHQFGTNRSLPYIITASDSSATKVVNGRRVFSGTVLMKSRGLFNNISGAARNQLSAVTRTETVRDIRYTSTTANTSSRSVFYSNQGESNRIATRALVLAIRKGAANESLITRQNHYNAFGEVSAELDGRGNRTELRYDQRGKLLAKVSPQEALYNEKLEAINGKAVERYGYNAFGEQVLQHNYVEAANDASADTKAKINAYNSKHEQISTRRVHNDRVMQERDAEGYNRSFHYDVFGNLRAEVREVFKRGERSDNTDAWFAKLLYSYNANNQRIRVDKLEENHAAILNSDNRTLRNAGVYDRFAYDEQGNRTEQWNALHAKTNSKHLYRYDGAGRVVEHKSAAGKVTKYAYRYSDDVQRRIATTVGSYEDQSFTRKTMGGYIVSRWNARMAASGMSGNVINLQHLSHEDVLTEVKDYFGKIVQKNDLGKQQFHYFYNTAGWLSRQTGSTAKSGDAVWETRRNQDIRFQYHHNGYLYKKLDFGISQALDGDTRTPGSRRESAVTEYFYDKNGNRTREIYYRGNDLFEKAGRTVFQHSTAVYDNRNRIEKITGNDEYGSHYQISYKYDAFNNRRAVESLYNGHYVSRPDGGIEGTPQNFYYTYDRKNRFTLTLGEFKNGQVTAGQTGIRVQWNGIDQRHIVTTSDTNPQRERYSYDVNGSLKQVEIDRNPEKKFVIRSERMTNEAGQVVQNIHYDGRGKLEGSKKTTLTNVFDNDGVIQRSVNHDHSNGDIITKQYKYLNDAGSDMESLVVTGNKENFTQQTYTYKYEKWDSYKQADIEVQGFNPALHPEQNRQWGPGKTRIAYDSNGHVRRARDEAGNREIAYATDSDGRVLVREDVQKYKSGAEKRARVMRHFYYHNGHTVGDIGTDGVTSRRDYATSLAQVDANKSGGGSDQVVPVESVDFDQNYQPINPGNPGDSFGLYEVQTTGEPLKVIAANLWGDSALWYLLADANGLKADTVLKKGQRLTIPNVVTNIHNNSETFRPYDAGLALGDTNPTLPDVPPPPPPKKKKGCGGFATVIIVIVAVVATVFTAGAASLALAGAGALGSATAGGIATAGLSVLGGGALLGATGAAGVAGALGAAFAGGFVGSLAGQVAGVALGVQDSVSLKSAFKSGLTSTFGSVAGAGTQGLVGNFGTATTAANGTTIAPSWYSVAARAALSSAAGNALGSAAGISSFSWRKVAVSAVSAGATRALGSTALGEAVGLDEAAQKSDSFLDQLPGQVTEELIGEAVQTAIYGDKFDFAGVAGNAIGNSFKNSLAYTDTVRTAEQQADLEKKNLERLKKIQEDAHASIDKTSAQTVARDQKAQNAELADRSLAKAEKRAFADIEADAVKDQDRLIAEATAALPIINDSKESPVKGASLSSSQLVIDVDEKISLGDRGGFVSGFNKNDSVENVHNAIEAGSYINKFLAFATNQDTQNVKTSRAFYTFEQKGVRFRSGAGKGINYSKQPIFPGSFQFSPSIDKGSIKTLYKFNSEFSGSLLTRKALDKIGQWDVAKAPKPSFDVSPRTVATGDVRTTSIHTKTVTVDAAKPIAKTSYSTAFKALDHPSLGALPGVVTYAASDNYGDPRQIATLLVDSVYGVANAYVSTEVGIVVGGATTVAASPTLAAAPFIGATTGVAASYATSKAMDYVYKDIKIGGSPLYEHSIDMVTSTVEAAIPIIDAVDNWIDGYEFDLF